MKKRGEDRPHEQVGPERVAEPADAGDAVERDLRREPAQDHRRREQEAGVDDAERRAEQVAVAELHQPADEHPERAGAERDGHEQARVDVEQLGVGQRQHEDREPEREHGERDPARGLRKYWVAPRAALRRAAAVDMAGLPSAREQLFEDVVDVLGVDRVGAAARRSGPTRPGSRAAPRWACGSTAYSSSSGGKYRSFSAGSDDRLGLDRLQRLDVVAVEARASVPMSPFCHVHSIVSRLLGSRRSRKKPSQNATRKSSSVE